MCNDEVDMVECIDDDWYRGGEAGAVKTPPPFPSKGSIYTVIGARKVQHNGVALLCYALWEMPIRQGLWEADKFRPVRRPSIETLRGLLKTKPQDYVGGPTTVQGQFVQHDNCRCTLLPKRGVHSPQASGSARR